MTDELFNGYECRTASFSLAFNKIGVERYFNINSLHKIVYARNSLAFTGRIYNFIF